MPGDDALRHRGQRRIDAQWRPPLDCFVARASRNDTRSSRDVFRPIVVHATNLLPPNKKGGGAPIGAMAPHHRMRRRALISFSACGGGWEGARPPFGAPPRHSPGRSQPWLASDPRFLRITESLAPTGGTLSPVSVLASPSGPVVAPDGRGPSRPGAVGETARGHRTRSTFRIASRKRPSLSEYRYLSGDQCQ